MHRQRALTHFTGGIAMQVMSNRGSGAAVEVAAPAPPPTREQILVPLDLVACTTQRNVLLIMDSNNAQVFSQLRSMGIGKPPLLLLSPANPPDIVRVASVVRLLLNTARHPRSLQPNPGILKPAAAKVQLLRLRCTRPYADLPCMSGRCGVPSLGKLLSVLRVVGFAASFRVYHVRSRFMHSPLTTYTALLCDEGAVGRCQLSTRPCRAASVYHDFALTVEIDVDSFIGAVQPEPIFTLFLTHPVLALIRLFRLNTTPTLLGSLHKAIDDLLEVPRTSTAAHSLSPTEQLRDCGVGESPWARGEYEAYAAADAAKPRSVQSSSEERQPWEAVLGDPFAARIVLRFALCRCVYSRAVQLRAPCAKNGKIWGVTASSSGQTADEGSSEGEGAEGGTRAAHLPQALPELPETLSIDAPLLAERVDILLKDLCGVEVQKV